MSSANLKIITTIETGSKVIKDHLSNINLVTLWAEGFNLKATYPYKIKFSLILLRKPDGATFLFDLLTCPDLDNLLRPLLESPTIIKVIFNHSELRKALWTQLKINLTSFFDCQLALRSKVNQINPSFDDICEFFGLKNEFIEENSSKNPKFWLERPFTPEMVSISNKNATLLNQIHQKLSLTSKESTHDLKILNEVTLKSQKPKNGVKIRKIEPIFVLGDPTSAIQEILDLYPWSIGVKFLPGAILMKPFKPFKLIAISTVKKIYIFNQDSAIESLKPIFEAEYLTKVVYNFDPRIFKEPGLKGIEPKNFFDLVSDTMRFDGEKICQFLGERSINLLEICKYFKPEIGPEYEEKFSSSDILEALGAEMELYYFLFGNLRRLQESKVSEVKVPPPKVQKCANEELKVAKKSESSAKNPDPNFERLFAEAGPSSGNPRRFAWTMNSPDNHLCKKSDSKAIKPFPFPVEDPDFNANQEFGEVIIREIYCPGLSELLAYHMPNSGWDFNYRKINVKFADKTVEFQEFIQILMRCRLFSLDFKITGDEVSLIIIGTEQNIFIFDVNVKNNVTYLKELLENHSIQKIMFQPTEFVNILENQYEILLSNVVDASALVTCKFGAILKAWKHIQFVIIANERIYWRSRPLQGLALQIAPKMANLLINGADEILECFSLVSPQGSTSEIDPKKELAQEIQNLRLISDWNLDPQKVDKMLKLLESVGKDAKPGVVMDKAVQTLFSGNIYGSTLAHSEELEN